MIRLKCNIKLEMLDQESLEQVMNWVKQGIIEREEEKVDKRQELIKQIEGESRVLHRGDLVYGKSETPKPIFYKRKRVDLIPTAKLLELRNKYKRNVVREQDVAKYIRVNDIPMSLNEIYKGLYKIKSNIGGATAVRIRGYLDNAHGIRKIQYKSGFKYCSKKVYDILKSELRTEKHLKQKRKKSAFNKFMSEHMKYHLNVDRMLLAEAHRISIAEWNALKPKILREEVKHDKVGKLQELKYFPNFETLHDENSLRILEGICKNIIKNGEKIDYENAKYTLALFDYKDYKMFLAEFLEKGRDVSDFFGVPNNFAVFDNSIVYR